MTTLPYEKKEVLLSAKDLGIQFKDKVIFKDVNLQIKDIIRPGIITGQVVSLIGKSGIGKSLLIRRLAGLYIKNASLTGEVLVNKDQKPVKPGDMGVVPQDYYLPANLTVQKILWMAAVKNPQFKDRKTIIAAMTSYILAFELGDHRLKYPIQLSGGQKQRTSIAMQLLSGSNFLLMDEPFSGLDPIMVDKTTDLLLRVSQTDELKTIVIVSHDLRNACAISDTVFILSNRDRSSEAGATIVKEVDLIERNLAWKPGIKEMPEFLDTIREIKQLL